MNLTCVRHKAEDILLSDRQSATPLTWQTLQNCKLRNWPRNTSSSYCIPCIELWGNVV